MRETFYLYWCWQRPPLAATLETKPFFSLTTFCHEPLFPLLVRVGRPKQKTFCALLTQPHPPRGQSLSEETSFYHKWKISIMLNSSFSFMKNHTLTFINCGKWHNSGVPVKYFRFQHFECSDTLRFTAMIILKYFGDHIKELRQLL